jgi:hypothetical protein
MITGFNDISEPLLRYLEMAVDIDTGIPQFMQSSTVLKVLLIAIAIVWASIIYLTVYNTLDITAERCHIRCMLYGIWLTATALVFGNSMGSLVWMLPMMPLSFFLYAFFCRLTQKRIGIFLLSLLILVIIAERIVILL